MTKNKKIELICKRCGKRFKVSPSHAKRNKKYCSLYCSNHGIKKNTGKTHFKLGHIPWNKGLYIDLRKTDLKIIGKKISNSRKGHEVNEETRKKISATQQGISIQDWKKFTQSYNRKLRSSQMWKIWRNAVFLRDNFTCQNPNCPYCHNKIGVFLHPHHIKPLSKFPDLAFDVNNGITYCKEYHLHSGLHKLEVKGG